MISNIIEKQVLSTNNNEIMPVYYQGELANTWQIVGHQLKKHTVRIALRVDAAIVSTWEK